MDKSEEKGILECNNALQFDKMRVFFSTYLNLNPKNGFNLKLIIRKGIFIILAKKDFGKSYLWKDKVFL